jgi:bacteriocin-like protein
MQALRSFFTRTPAPDASTEVKTPPQQLDEKQLAQVSGGLPRVGPCAIATEVIEYLPAVE